MNGVTRPWACHWTAELRRWSMTDNLEVVTVRPNDEGGIVIGVIVRANPRRTVVFASSSESLTIERVFLTTIVCREGDVKR